MLCPLWRPFPRWFRRGLRVTFEHNIHMLNWYFPLYINVLWSWDTNWIFSVCIVTQWKIKMQTIQYRRSRIREMKEDKYTKSLAKNQVCAIFQRRDIRKNGLPKFIKLLLWKPYVGKGTQIWPPDTNRNICFRVFLLMREFFAWGTHKEWSNIYSETRNV